MSRDELLAYLRSLADYGDPEAQHAQADAALLDYVGDEEIAEAFHAIPKWYA